MSYPPQAKIDPQDLSGKAGYNVVVNQTETGYTTTAPSGGFSNTIKLNHAQIIALPTTSIEVIPAPGAGKVIIVTAIRWVAKIVAPYNNISSAADGAFLYLAYSKNPEGANGNPIDSGIQNTSFANYMTGLLQNTTPTIYTVDSSQVRFRAGFNEFSVESVLISDVENTAVKTNCYNNDGNYTDGDPANTIKVVVSYMTFDV